MSDLYMIERLWRLNPLAIDWQQFGADVQSLQGDVGGKRAIVIKNPGPNTIHFLIEGEVTTLIPGNSYTVEADTLVDGVWCD